MRPLTGVLAPNREVHDGGFESEGFQDGGFQDGGLQDGGLKYGGLPEAYTINPQNLRTKPHFGETSLLGVAEAAALPLPARPAARRAGLAARHAGPGRRWPGQLDTAAAAAAATVVFYS